MPELPNEILQTIVRHLASLRDVKNVRLANKTFATMAEPVLFNRVGLVPYVDCLEDFAQTMQHNPTIARHVKILIYEVSTRYTPGFSVGFAERSGQADTFNEHLEVNSLEYQDQDTEIKLFSRCVQLLPRLTSIRLHGCKGRRHSSLPAAFEGYYQRFCQLEGVFAIDDRIYLNEYSLPISKPIDSWTPKVALFAVAWASESSITSFRVASLDLDGFMAECREELPKVRSVFSKLKDIRIRCGIEYGMASPVRHQARQALVDLVASAADLEKLQLTLNDFVFFGRREPHGPQTSCLRGLVRLPDYNLREDPMFSSLEYLDLGCMAFQAIELSALISNHRHTLRRLVLRDLRLAEAHHRDPPPCWVRTFKEIRSYHIPYIELDGAFKNPTHQQWVIHGHDQDPTCLSRRVQAWLVGKGEEACPIEHAAVRLDSSGREIVPLKEDRSVGDESFWEDTGDNPSDDSDGEDHSDDDSHTSTEHADDVFFGGPFIEDDEEDEEDEEGWDDDLPSPKLSSEDEHYVAYRQGTNHA
ncbi:hypothetical protein LTS15_001710 [Exophiala xenobiotica]|nr:hypothetical protein LTS15_001710 [Exophiala xenobiotica]